MDISEGEDGYESKYDIVQYGSIGLESLQYAVTNTDQTIKIIDDKE